MRTLQPSRAADKVRKELDRRAWSQADLAVRLGVSQQAVSNWLSGFARPDPTHMVSVEKLLAVPMRDWMTASRRAVRVRLSEA